MNVKRDDIDGTEPGGTPAGWATGEGFVMPKWDAPDVVAPHQDKPSPDKEADNATPAGPPAPGGLVLPDWDEEESEASRDARVGKGDGSGPTGYVPPGGATGEGKIEPDGL